ncbi:acyltransferase family protein [Hymenobacter persicinus]|uniref:Acyltransferase n=1 Tax=Hymenobacter persicinus TaxID=2025506 RepID=A0A4Q5L8B0_9BACT|nr:acyltransferase [Hymenobacter persicinus]RYU77860.1 acyltransferase [Hymenobacter persicinus]
MEKLLPAASKKYIPSLTGMRAIAAFMVFVCHNPINYAQPLTPLQRAGNGLLVAFDIGVAIFFVLSGFLITLRYAENITLSWQWIVRYTRNRMARIYPMYFLVTVVTIVASQLSTAYDPSRVWQYFSPTDKAIAIFANLTFIRGFFSNLTWTLAGQGWSLTVEECFYLAAPFMLLSVMRQPKLLPLWALGLLATGFALVGVGSLAPEHLYGFFKTVRFMLNWTFFGRCIEFVLGMGLGLYVIKRPKPQVATGWATYLGSAWMGLCMLAFTAFEFSHDPGPIPGLTTYSAIFVHNVLLPLGIVALFWGLIHEQTVVRRLLETDLFSLLGKSSYVFYLTHVGVLNFLIEYHLTTNVLVKFVLMNLVSIGLYKLVEHPIHRWLTQRAKPRPVAVAA